MQSDETLASELHCEDVRGDEQILTDFEFSTLGPPVCMSLTDLIAAIPIIIDADHDLDVPRKCNAISNPFEASDEDELQQDPMVNSWASFQLGHRSRSTLDRVGLQVWRGALLLCDAVCVLDCMKGSVVIEMGASSDTRKPSPLHITATLEYKPRPLKQDNCIKRLEFSTTLPQEAERVSQHSPVRWQASTPSLRPISPIPSSSRISAPTFSRPPTSH